MAPKTIKMEHPGPGGGNVVVPENQQTYEKNNININTKNQNKEK